MKNTERLRRILDRQKTVLVPGAYDAFSARILKQAGFKVLYMTGSGVTASLIGMPDVGLLTMTEMVTQARNIVDAVDLPVICDADDGYGNAISVIRTVRAFERAGVAGIHIEDQVSPKKCGHFEGKQVIAAPEMLQKIEAAVQAREDESFLLIARTDALAIHGLEDAIKRVRHYAEAGADMVFLEAPRSTEDLCTIAEKLSDIHLLVNMVEGGKTPVLPFEDFEEMGFKIVLYPTSSIRAVAKTLQDLAVHLYRHRNTKDFEERLVTFEGRNEITGLARIIELEEQFATAKSQ